jgi:hypothetical protein
MLDERGGIDGGPSDRTMGRWTTISKTLVLRSISVARAWVAPRMSMPLRRSS